MFTVLLAIVIFSSTTCLFPHESSTRERRLLDGLWRFKADFSEKRDEGFAERWYTKSFEQLDGVLFVAVPSSYNDLTVDPRLRDFVGWVWYQVDTIIPQSWLPDTGTSNIDEWRRTSNSIDLNKQKYQNNNIIKLLLQSCHYYCIVWVNGVEVAQHEGGHLPFEADMSSLIKAGQANTITVAVNNTLTPSSVPPGKIVYPSDMSRYPRGFFYQDYTFDFFNYAGIDRSISLYRIPDVHISDLVLNTTISKEGLGIIDIRVQLNSRPEAVKVVCTVLDQNTPVAVENCNLDAPCSLSVPNVNLWWPVGMSSQPGYLYQMELKLLVDNHVRDVYGIPFGFRTVQVDGNRFLINQEPFYFHGVNKHEDSDIRGKGFDWPVVLRDFSLMKWLNANAFRTSHYPYDEQILQMADREGIVVISEAPAVGMDGPFGEDLLKLHLSIMQELVTRDRNHPCVVMWSVANEPASDRIDAEPYFREVFNYTRALDPTRPVTFVTKFRAYNDVVAKFSDVLSVNRYYAWYSDSGMLELIPQQLFLELSEWMLKYSEKPVIQMEYGADAVAGLHTLPASMFTEEYQEETMAQYFAIFDKMRQQSLCGEMVWNFADFATKQGTTRVVGNRKGLFTRQRQPKQAAFQIRSRYQNISSTTLKIDHSDKHRHHSL